MAGDLLDLMPLRKLVLVLAACLVLVSLSACGGRTTTATNIASTSATLNAVAHCDVAQVCTWYWEYWRASGPRSASVKTTVLGPVKGASPDVKLSQPINGLASSATYRWVLCGSPNGGASYACVGPQGIVGSSTADPPPDFATLTTAGKTQALVNTTPPRISVASGPTDPITEYLTTLSADPGTWSGTAPVTYSFQWQDCSGATAGSSCSSIAGATGRTYTPTQRDVGYNLRVLVSATDAAVPPVTVQVASAAVASVSPQMQTADVTCSASGGAIGTVIYLHGGAFFYGISLDEARSICSFWASRGFDTNVVDYTLANVAQAEADSETASTSASTRPVFAVGLSAGGTLAEWLAVQAKVKAAVSTAGISDLTSWGSDAFWESAVPMTTAQRAAASPVLALSSTTVTPTNVRLYHSPTDAIVPYQQSVKMLDAMQARCGSGCASLIDLTGEHGVDNSWLQSAADWLAGQ